MTSVMDRRAFIGTLAGGLPPILKSQHQASEFVADNQRRDLLKRCAHLSIQPVDPAGSAVFYRIICAKDSFEVVPPVEFMGVGIHDRHRRYIIPAG
jgi:hypothetical protein